MTSSRLNVYIALDTSGSMRGEPIQAVNVGLQSMLASMRQNPIALESVHLSIITFDAKINEVLPLTPLPQVALPQITCPESGPTFLGEALMYVCEKAQREVRTAEAAQTADWRPLLFIMTDGKPSDTMVFNESIAVVKATHFASVVACAAGPKAVPDQLKQLTDKVVSLDTMDSASFSSFFQWVGAAVAANGGGNAAPDLPPPPAEVHVVF
ncbi:vWA domain-containing protein [Pseudoduganella sp. HUAS MS19]